MMIDSVLPIYTPEAYQSYYVIKGKKIPQDLYDMYCTIVSELHTWADMGELYQEDLDLALVMVEILDEPMKK